MSFPRCLLVFGLASSSLWAQVSDSDFAAIKKQGFAESQVMEHLDHLVNRIGPRLTGSDNLTVACEWAVQHFKSFGIENARMEQWGTYPVGFNRGPWWGRMTAPEAMEFVCSTDAWTAGTRGPARGRVLMAPNDEAELEKLRGQLGGAWLVLTRTPRGAFVRQLTEAMIAEGGLGMITGREGPRGELLLTGGEYRITFGELPKLPMVRVRNDNYEALLKHLDAGTPVEVEFDIRNHFRDGPIPLYNVIADIPGTEFPDEYVVVGGHIDSWDGATGTTDNGTGTATTFEAARILMAIGAKPRRTIRFMLWSGEEQGLMGSLAWVQEHKEEMGRYSACLVHDGGTNYVSGIGGMKEMRPQLETAFAQCMGLSEQLPFTIRDIEAFRPIGSDHEAFTGAGVPGFFWMQSGRANYTHTHHTQYDTYDAAIPEYQRHSSVVIAAGALGIANLPELLTRENMVVQRGWGGGGGGRRGGRRLGVQLKPDTTTIDALTDGGAAQKAGLKVGDVLLKVGDTKIESIRDLFTALGGDKPKLPVTVKRGDQEVTVQIEFPAPSGGGGGR